MNIHRLAGWLGFILIAIGASVIGCKTLTRESPWEPVPPNYTTTLTAIAQRATPAPSNTAPSAPTNSIVTPTLAAMPVNGINARLNEPFTIGISQWATITDTNKTRVFFTTMLEDTRCALDINCFQAGWSRVAVTLESEGRLARFDLSTNPMDRRRVGTFNNYLVEFIDIAPARKQANVPIPLNDYKVTLRITRGSFAMSRARFNEPFTLKPGQAIEFEEGDMRLLFESVKQDSRCPTRVLCATSGSATLAVRLTFSGINQQPITLDVGGDQVLTAYPIVRKVAGYVRASALTPHPQQEFASKEIAPSEYEATFIVFDPAAAQMTPVPRALTACPDLLRGDASEILGEAIQDKPADLILFQPTTIVLTLRGACGYGSVAFTPNKTRSLNVPNVSPASAQADRAVIAGKFTDNQRFDQLISIAGVIEAVNPRGGGTLAPKLMTMYGAGVWRRDLINDFPDAARGATGVTVKRVNDLGDNAIWVWREFEGMRYAALVAQKGDTLFVIAAIVNEQRAQDALIATMTSVIQKMLR